MPITQLDSENADRNLTVTVTVLTHTPNVSAAMLCQGLICLGDGVKNLNGTGGSFELTVTVGGQTIQPNPQTVIFGTEVRSAVWTTPFPVSANTEVILRVKSPNAADSDVDVTAYLYDVGQQQTGDAFARLATYRLGELLSAALAAPAADSLFAELTEDDGGIQRFTANALEQGGGATTAEIATAVEALDIFDELIVLINTRSTYAGGPVQSVTDPVTVGDINDNVIDAGTIATDAIDNDAIADDVQLGSGHVQGGPCK